ncbi:MAG: YajQ family cyclic di-GMP-binding protein [Deltaproteobacteria bacterium]|nr:YajQ family cyclic di-GMP-binding protein [Deltaproteobacteria bacterium]
MPSFDIVSEVNRQEVENAVHQAEKEIVTRYDFKGSKSRISLDKDGIHLLSDDEFKMRALLDIVQSKLIKRGIDLKSLEFGKVEPGPTSLVKCLIKIISGIESEKAKELVKIVKDLKLKVQASIQAEQVRVTGKDRDDLQSVIAILRGKDFPLPLQFTNFRD